jgi:hypothetical protein
MPHLLKLGNGHPSWVFADGMASLAPLKARTIIATHAPALAKLSMAVVRPRA